MRFALRFLNLYHPKCIMCDLRFALRFLPLFCGETQPCISLHFIYFTLPIYLLYKLYISKRVDLFSFIENTPILIIVHKKCFSISNLHHTFLSLKNITCKSRKHSNIIQEKDDDHDYSRNPPNYGG